MKITGWLNSRSALSIKQNVKNTLQTLRDGIYEESDTKLKDKKMREAYLSLQLIQKEMQSIKTITA